MARPIDEIRQDIMETEALKNTLETEIGALTEERDSEQAKADDAFERVERYEEGRDDFEIDLHQREARETAENDTYERELQEGRMSESEYQLGKYHDEEGDDAYKDAPKSMEGYDARTEAVRDIGEECLEKVDRCNAEIESRVEQVQELDAKIDALKEEAMEAEMEDRGEADGEQPVDISEGVDGDVVTYEEDVSQEASVETTREGEPAEDKEDANGSEKEDDDITNKVDGDKVVEDNDDTSDVTNDTGDTGDVEDDSTDSDTDKCDTGNGDDNGGDDGGSGNDL